MFFLFTEGRQIKRGKSILILNAHKSFRVFIAFKTFEGKIQMTDNRSSIIRSAFEPDSIWIMRKFKHLSNTDNTAMHEFRLTDNPTADSLPLGDKIIHI